MEEQAQEMRLRVVLSPSPGHGGGLAFFPPTPSDPSGTPQVCGPVLAAPSGAHGLVDIHAPVPLSPAPEGWASSR